LPYTYLPRSLSFQSQSRQICITTVAASNYCRERKTQVRLINPPVYSTLPLVASKSTIPIDEVRLFTIQYRHRYPHCSRKRLARLKMHASLISSKKHHMKIEKVAQNATQPPISALLSETKGVLPYCRLQRFCFCCVVSNLSVDSRREA